MAHNIAKPKDQVAYTKVPIFWSSIGKGLRYLGTGAGFDETYTDGNVDELKLSPIDYSTSDGHAYEQGLMKNSLPLTKRRTARSQPSPPCSAIQLWPRLRS